MNRASGLRGFRELVTQLGGDPDALLRRHHVEPDLLQDEDALYPLRSFVTLLEEAAHICEVPDFGLRLAQTQDIGILGPISVAAQNAATLLEAMQCVSRFLFVQSPGIAFTVLERSELDPKWAEMRYEILLPRLPTKRQALEHGLLVAHRIMTRMVPDAYRAEEIHLPHVTLARGAVYGKHFNARIRQEQEHAAILLRRDVLQAPMKAVNESLRQMAIDYIGVRFPGPGQTISSRVRQAVSRTLTAGMASLEDVSGMMAMHPRTLRRKLAAEGHTFEDIRDAVRRELAVRYLTSTQMPLSQVSGLLGFSAQSALTRVCWRWFGMSPKQVRQSDQSILIQG